MDTNLYNLLLQSQSQNTTVNWPGLIAAIVASIPAILAYFKSAKVEKDVKEVHLSINSRLDQWLAIEKAQGKTEAKQEAEQVKQDAVAAVPPVKP